MKQRQLQVFFICCFLLIQIFAFNATYFGSSSVAAKSSSTASNSTLFPDPHTLTTNIIALNYANDKTFTNTILNSLPSSISVLNGIQNITYYLKYNLIFPSSAFVTNFTNYVSSISTPNSPTVDVNQTALRYQAVNNTVQNIFINKTGTAIDGIALENWLWTNGQQFKNNSISYQIFLLNLTYIPSKLYWFNIPEPDAVTGQQRHEWRLEWDYPPTGTVNNFNAKFPYPGYASKYPMYYLDPSAFNWYLNWTRIWRNIPSQEVAKDPYYLNSFSSYLHNIGGFLANEGLAGSYIGNWLSEIVHNLFVFQPLNGIVTPPSLNFQVAVLTNSTTADPFPNLNWIINDSLVKKQLQRVLPHSSIAVSTTFYNISNYSSVSQLLAQNKVSGPSPPPVPDYSYYDANNLFFQFPNLDNSFFNPPSAQMNLRAYVLILDNASFVGAPWNGGGLLTGLGGNERVLILYEVDRLFYNRTTNPIPKESISKVLIHEAGHAIGFPHPFNEQSNTYASDFLSEAMGYYSSSSNYSTFFIDNFQRLSIESNISSVLKTLWSINLSNVNSTILSELSSNYTLFYKYYHILDFQQATEYLFNLQLLIKKYFPNSSNLQTAPIISGSSSNEQITLGSNITFTWLIYDPNPNYYEIFINKSTSGPQSWNTSSRVISYMFKGESLGKFNISLVAINKENKQSIVSFFVIVTQPSTISSASKRGLFASIDPFYSVFIPILCIIPIYIHRKR